MAVSRWVWKINRKSSKKVFQTNGCHVNPAGFLKTWNNAIKCLCARTRRSFGYTNRAGISDISLCIFHLIKRDRLSTYFTLRLKQFQVRMPKIFRSLIYVSLCNQNCAIDVNFELRRALQRDINYFVQNCHCNRVLQQRHLNLGN